MGAGSRSLRECSLLGEDYGDVHCTCKSHDRSMVWEFLVSTRTAVDVVVVLRGPVGFKGCPQSQIPRFLDSPQSWPS